MTMTGRTIPDIRPEFEPTDCVVAWGSCLGAIDAGVTIPAGSTVACFKGHMGFGVPESIARERLK